MEDVLDLYHEACEPERPRLVGFNETSRQLVEDVRSTHQSQVSDGWNAMTASTSEPGTRNL